MATVAPSASPASSPYQTIAAHIQHLSSRTPAEEIFDEALEEVRKKPGVLQDDRLSRLLHARDIKAVQDISFKAHALSKIFGTDSLLGADGKVQKVLSVVKHAESLLSGFASMSTSRAGRSDESPLNSRIGNTIGAPVWGICLFITSVR